MYLPRGINPNLIQYFKKNVNLIHFKIIEIPEKLRKLDTFQFNLIEKD